MQKTQFSSGHFLFNEKQKKPFVSLSFIIRIITQISYCCFVAQAIKARNGVGQDLFCRDNSSIQDPLLFLFFSVPLSISQTKLLFKNKLAVEPAKSNRLSSGRVEICLRKIC